MLERGRKKLESITAGRIFKWEKKLRRIRKLGRIFKWEKKLRKKDDKSLERIC